jgi:hypothetical protein
MLQRSANNAPVSRPRHTRALGQLLLSQLAEQTDDTATDTTHHLLLKNPWPAGMLQGTVNWYNGGLGAWVNASGQNMHWG